jgi:tetratricopeptide (TPR) repeat protein
LAGSYLKSLQLQKQLEERAKEATKNREVAEKEYESLQELLKLCADSDVNTSEVEESRRDFDAAMASKDYQTAIGQARKAQEAAKNAYINKIGEVGDSVEILLNLIRGAGSEAKSASDQLEKSKERLVKEDMEGAMKLAKSAYDSAERTLHEVFSELFSQTQETIMQAKEMGDDVSIFDNQLSKAKTALEEQEYEECMSTIKEVLEGAGEDIKAQVGSTISRAEELLSAGEDFGTDMSKVRNHIERARAQLEGLKFKESLAYAKKAEVEGESAISARLQEQVRETRESIKRMKTVKEDVTIPQQMLDQAQAALKDKKYIEALHALNTAKERSNEIQFNSVLDVIAQARDRFVLAKKVGVDMAKAITLLNTSRDNLKLGKFQEAIDYAEQSRKEVDEALEMFYKARDQIVELAKAVKFAGDLGADVISVKDLLADARKYFENKDYENTAETTKKGLAESKKLAYDKTMEIMDVSDKEVKLGKQIGADMTEAEGILHKALDMLSKEDLTETANLARSSHDAAKAAMTRVMSDKLQNIDQFVKGYPNAGALGEINEMIAQSRQYVAGSEFDKAHTLLNEITQNIESIGQGECDRLISTARAKVETIHSMGEEVSDLEILLTRANDALRRRVFENATARAREIIEQADEIIANLVQAQFSSVKDSLEEAKTIGIDIEESKIALKEARAKLDSMDYREAFRLVKETNQALRSKIARYDGIKGKIRKTEELISEAGRTKVDVTNLIRKLENARATFVGGGLDEAEQLVDEVLAETERNMAMYLAAKFILSSKDRIDLAQTNGIDVGTASKLLAKSKDLMKAKNYEDALKTAKQCDEESRNRIANAISSMILELQRLLADAKNVGVDTIGPEKLAEKASELAKAGDFAEALRCIASAKEDIGHIKNLSSQAALEIRVARNNLKDAETLDMDVGRARDFLDQAVEALTRHQYAIALELARKSSEISMEVSKSRIWETLEKFKEKLEKSAAEGASLGTAERCVSDGIQAFREGRYQESLKLAMACEVEMERAELQRDISKRAVDLARKKLSDAAVEGIKSDRLSELVNRAEALLASGKYVDAMTAAIASGDELHLIRENDDSCRVELSSVRERIERLRKVRIDTTECDEILEMAQEYLSAHEFAKCRDALKRLSEKAESLFENSLEDVMDQNRQMIFKAKSMGIDTKACEDLMEVANTSFNEKLWDFAYQQAMACRSSCLELVAKKITALIEEVQAKIANLRSLGASTVQIEDMVEKARVAGSAGRIAEAFQMLMQVDARMTTIEESHKKFMDISIAAESAIDSLGRFGMSRREPERLMAMADIEKEKDYDSAIELVAEALDTAKNLMESCAPDLSGSVSSRGLQEKVEGDLVLTVKNAGKAVAKDVAIEFTGDFQLKELPPAVTIKPGSEETVKIKLTPKRSGSVQFKISLATKRPYDGKLVSSEIEDSVNVFAAGPPFKLGRATDQTRCISCQGRIKPGFDVLNCRCGGQLHLSCAKRVGECPVCGQKYSF